MTSDGKIVPYRMSVLMEIAAKVAKTMVTGAVSLSYEEMDWRFCYFTEMTGGGKLSSAVQSGL